MNDYLSNLIAKNTNQGGDIQPRPPALFEPPTGVVQSAAADLAGFQTDEGETEAGETMLNATPARPMRNTPAPVRVQPPQSGELLTSFDRRIQQMRDDLLMRAVPAAAPLPIETEPRPAQSGGDSSWPTASPVAASPAKPTTISPDSQQTPPTRPPLSLPPAVKSAEAGSRLTLPPSSPKTNTVIGSQAISLSLQSVASSPSSTPSGIMPYGEQSSRPNNVRPVLEPIIQPAVVQQIDAQPAAPAAEIARPPSPVERSRQTAAPQKDQLPGTLTPPARSAPAVLPSLIRPLVEVVSPTSKEPAQPQAAPTIQVSIGRIEVRATPSSVSRSKRQPVKAPVMSLETYLRQRNQGGNR